MSGLRAYTGFALVAASGGCAPAVRHRFSSRDFSGCRRQALESRLSCPEARGIQVSGPGIEPASPALAGGFLTAGPPGKPSEGMF